MSEDKGYNVIFRSTFLFGFVQVFNIAVKIVLNKVAAITIGTNGVGLIGLYSSAIGMLKTGTGLGISQSAVRDISEANERNDIERFSKTIVTTNNVILFTAFLGLFVTIVFSPQLSKWTFGNGFYSEDFMLLSLAVVFTTLWEGQLAILKGLRRLRLLAKANVFGSAFGLFISIPLYFIYEMKGIIPVLIITPLVSLICSSIYVRKIKYKRIRLSYKELFQTASPMMKMGTALSFAMFLTHISTFTISAYIGSSEGGLKHLGYYNAGVMIMVGYFSVVINALTTDYFPRISAVNNNNNRLQEELNKQSIVSLLITFPLIILFLFLLPLVIVILYSKDFYQTIEFVRIGIYGTLITICSNQVDLILIAKNNTKTYTCIAIFFRIIELILNIYLYKYYGLTGLGVAILLTGIIHMSIMTIVVKKLYSIQFNKLFIRTAFVVLLLVLFSSIISTMDNALIKYSIGCGIFILSCYFSFFYTKKYLNINLLRIFT